MRFKRAPSKPHRSKGVTNCGATDLLFLLRRELQLAGRCTADIFDERYAVLAESVIAFGVDYGAFSFGLVCPRADVVVLSRCLPDLQAQHHERGSHKSALPCYVIAS